MNQTDNIQKSALQDFSVLSFGSGPNQSFQIDQDFQKQQNQNSYGYKFIIAFVVLGFYFLVFGIIELATNFNQVLYQFQLKRIGNVYLSNRQFVSFTENTQISIYLEIQKYTQFDISLNSPFEQTQQERCKSFRTNQQMMKINSIMNTTLLPDARAIPCGKYFYMYPQGNFEMIQTQLNRNVVINTDRISSLQSSLNYHNINKSMQWADFQTTRFNNWVQIDTHKSIKKLWGSISQVVSGNYQIRLTVNNPIKDLQKINISLQNDESLSGYNNQLCYVNFFYAGFIFVAALSSFIIQKQLGHKKLLKKKPNSIGQANQIKIFLNSGSSTPAVKFQ